MKLVPRFMMKVVVFTAWAFLLLNFYRTSTKSFTTQKHGSTLKSVILNDSSNATQKIQSKMIKSSVTYNAQTKSWKNIEKPSQLQILILSTNGRSGSSYLSDVLTPEILNPFYVFEPVRWLHQKPPANDNEALLSIPKFEQLAIKRYKSHPRHRNSGLVRVGETYPPENESEFIPPDLKRDLLQDVFQCSLSKFEPIIRSDTARNFVFRKPARSLGYQVLHKSNVSKVIEGASRDCRSAHLLLVKTIRLRLTDIVPYWKNLRPADLLNLQEAVKVVMLLRDPRAIMSSVLFSPDKWGTRFRNVTKVCQNIIDDLDVWSEYKDQYPIHLVKYEDLIFRSNETWTELLSFLNLGRLRKDILEEVNDRIISQEPRRTPDYLARLTNKRRMIARKLPDNSNTLEHRQGTESYYSTERESNFDPDHWKVNIPQALLHDIESEPKCLESMKRLNYTLKENGANLALNVLK